MTYKVVDIEGVGEVYAEKLIAAGIKTDAELLEKCAKPAGRKPLQASWIVPEAFSHRMKNCTNSPGFTICTVADRTPLLTL